MRPIDWEHSTFDEVLLVIKGKVDDWRTQRMLSYNLYCIQVKSPVSICDYCPLPFDEEIREAERKEADRALEVYNSRNFDEIIWPTKK